MKIIVTENQFRDLRIKLLEDELPLDTKYSNLSKFLGFLSNPEKTLENTPFFKRIKDMMGITADREEDVISNTANFQNPLGDSKYTITSQFGRPRGGRTHEGIDIGAPIGTPVFAPANGTVVDARDAGGRCGGYVKLDHGNVVTKYCHLSGWPNYMKPGTEISKGQIIAYVGNTGRSTGPHLHYEIRNKSNVALNPQQSKYGLG